MDEEARRAEEQRRYEAQQSRQELLDQRATTEFDQRQAEYNKQLADREWLKTYDPSAGGRALSTEAFGAVSKAVDRGAQDLVKADAGFKGVFEGTDIDTSQGFRYEDLESLPQEQQDVVKDRINALYGNPSPEGRDLLADLSTGIGGKVEGITKEAVLQEDVYSTVYNDVMRQTGDSALAAKEATARAGQYTSRADLKAQAEAAAKERQEVYKRKYDVSKDQLATRQKQQDYQFKALKEVLDLERAGSTATKVDGKKTYADAYDNLDKLDVTSWFWPSFTGIGDEAAGREVIELARKYEIPPSVIMREMNDNLSVGAGRGWNEGSAEKFVASVMAKYPDGYGKVTDSSRQNLIDRIPQMAAPTPEDLEIANKYRVGVSAIPVSEIQADRVQKAIASRFGVAPVARLQTPIEASNVTRPAIVPEVQGSGTVPANTAEQIALIKDQNATINELEGRMPLVGLEDTTVTENSPYVVPTVEELVARGRRSQEAKNKERNEARAEQLKRLQGFWEEFTDIRPRGETPVEMRPLTSFTPTVTQASVPLERQEEMSRWLLGNDSNVTTERVPNEVAEIVNTPANELSIADVDSVITRLQEDLTNPSNIRMDTSRQLSVALRALQEKRLEMLRMSPGFGEIVREVPEYP
jgi:hypothetical protein